MILSFESEKVQDNPATPLKTTVIESLGNFIQYSRHCQSKYRELVLALIYDEVKEISKTEVRDMSPEQAQTVARVINVINSNYDREQDQDYIGALFSGMLKDWMEDGTPQLKETAVMFAR